jgi:hypothetical protein
MIQDIQDRSANTDKHTGTPVEFSGLKTSGYSPQPPVRLRRSGKIGLRADATL